MGRITTGDHPKGVDSQPDVIVISFGQLVLRLGQLPECHCYPGGGFLALFEGRDNPSGRVVSRAKLPHPLLRQSRRICAFGRTPSRETLSIRKPQIHQELCPASPFGGKGGRKDSWGSLQPRRPLRPAKEKPDLGRSVDPKHFALLLIDQPRDFRWRAVLLHHMLGWRPLVPKRHNRGKQKNRETDLQGRGDARPDDGEISRKGAKRKGEETLDQDKCRIAVARRRGHGKLPRVGKEADVPNRGDNNGKDPCVENERRFDRWREPRGAEMQKKRQDRGGDNDRELRIERPAKHQECQHQAPAWAVRPQFNGAEAQGHRPGSRHEPSRAPGLRLHNKKRGKPIAKNRGSGYAAQTNQDDRCKNPPAASVLKMRGNGDCRCLNDEWRERFDWPILETRTDCATRGSPSRKDRSP